MESPSDTPTSRTRSIDTSCLISRSSRGSRSSGSSRTATELRLLRKIRRSKRAKKWTIPLVRDRVRKGIFTNWKTTIDSRKVLTTDQRRKTKSTSNALTPKNSSRNQSSSTKPKDKRETNWWEIITNPALRKSIITPITMPMLEALCYWITSPTTSTLLDSMLSTIGWTKLPTLIILRKIVTAKLVILLKIQKIWLHILKINPTSCKKTKNNLKILKTKTTLNTKTAKIRRTRRTLSTSSPSHSRSRSPIALPTQPTQSFQNTNTVKTRSTSPTTSTISIIPTLPVTTWIDRKTRSILRRWTLFSWSTSSRTSSTSWDQIEASTTSRWSTFQSRIWSHRRVT